MSRLVRIYPRSWRERYGEEFLALVSERPPSLADRVDIVRGAMRIRDGRSQPPTALVALARSALAIAVVQGVMRLTAEASAILGSS